MIVLLDNGQDLDKCESELGCPVGQLITPVTRYLIRDPSRPWAVDNGGFTRFNREYFHSIMNREEHRREQCLFVAVPDIVGSARRTLEVFEQWKPQLTGWTLALVCQDGQEDLPIPWSDIGAVFIGGTTKWKLSPHVEHIVRAAKALSKWVHVGRVNSPNRFRHFEKMGVDSCDGSGISQYTHMRDAIRNREDQGLF